MICPANNNLAIVFPGQGSQFVGMLADIATKFPIIQKTFSEASAVLNYDLWQLTQEGPADTLNQTVHTQPALLAASYAIWQILHANVALQPKILAGHSLGEYTALVCAKALSFADAIKLVAARGLYMQEAVAPGVGAMAAIVGLDEAAVFALCKEAIHSDQEILSPANFNSIGQIVIAGHMAAVERAISLAKKQGAKLAVMIPVSVPSHCQLMQPAAERLEKALQQVTISEPQIPVVNNVAATIYTTPAEIKASLVLQLTQPVRWVEIIQHFVEMQIETVIECGPGKILTGLNKRIDKNLQLMTTAEMVHCLVGAGC